MPRPSEEAKAAFARIVPDEPAVTIKPMFGQVSAFVNGNMFCGIFGEELMVRLPEDEIAKVKKQGGRDFEPMAGHKMSGYVIVPGDWRAKPPAHGAIKPSHCASSARTRCPVWRRTVVASVMVGRMHRDCLMCSRLTAPRR